MASEGPNNPGTMADDAAVGTIAWSNPDNAKISDNSDAVAAIGVADTSHYLKATNFGFSIPGGMTINGILVEIEKQTGSGGANDSGVFIVKSDDTLGSTNKAIGGVWPSTDTYISHGASDDLWDESWSSADINNSNFGVVISAVGGGLNRDANVDHIRITVYYTEAASGIVILRRRREGA